MRESSTEEISGVVEPFANFFKSSKTSLVVREKKRVVIL